MSDEKINAEEEEDSLEPSSSSAKTDKIAKFEKIEEILEAIPVPEQKAEAREILREFTKIIERPSQLDPETARILTDNIDKDNERRFKYLTQKQSDETELEKGEQELRKLKHTDGFSLVKPVVYAVLLIVILCVSVGIWLCANGKETLGAALITGSLSGVLSFAAGFGVSNLFKDEKKK